MKIVIDIKKDKYNSYEYIAKIDKGVTEQDIIQAIDMLVDHLNTRLSLRLVIDKLLKNWKLIK